MNSEEFIISKLDKFVDLFPGARVKYQHDEDACTHFVKVFPGKMYHLDKRYIAWENELTSCFVRAYTTEGICFISDDSTIELGNPLREWIGSNCWPLF